MMAQNGMDNDYGYNEPMVSNNCSSMNAGIIAGMGSCSAQPTRIDGSIPALIISFGHMTVITVDGFL